jgi:hypothetical protein
MKKALILIILIVLIIILAIGWLAWKGYKNSQYKMSQKETESLLISTYQIEYPEGENPKIKIENKSAKAMCFSSCYPYYLEKKDGTLKSYTYGNCPHEDTVENCIALGQVKAFELILDQTGVDKGLHRVAVPACIGCALQSNFRQDKFFYSNEFVIK